MLKKIALWIGLFALGLALGYWAESHLLTLMKWMYTSFLWGDLPISFVGKCFHFISPFYLLAFGAWMLVGGVRMVNLPTNQKILRGLLTTGIFFTALAIYCMLDVNSKMINCTMCDGSGLAIPCIDFDNQLIIIKCLLISIAANWIKITKN